VVQRCLKLPSAGLVIDNREPWPSATVGLVGEGWVPHFLVWVISVALRSKARAAITVVAWLSRSNATLKLHHQFGRSEKGNAK
jgi:hypothetical protein